MKCRQWPCTVAALLIASVSVVALLAWNRGRVGKVLDSYRSVPVYDNGLLFFRSYGKHYAPDSYYYGQKWQCVEFVKRFYYEAKQHKMPDVMGHARSFFDTTIPDGALNARRGLLQYRNGSTQRPRPDDLLVFTDTRYGHVGIVTETTEDSVEIIQQNILWHTRQRLSMMVSNRQYFITSPRIPAGWLRCPAVHDITSAHCAGPAGAMGSSPPPWSCGRWSFRGIKMSKSGGTG